MWCLEEPCCRGTLGSCAVVELHRCGAVEEPAFGGVVPCHGRDKLWG
jgi:hypothetical protein